MVGPNVGLYELAQATVCEGNEIHVCIPLVHNYRYNLDSMWQSTVLVCTQASTKI